MLHAWSVGHHSTSVTDLHYLKSVWLREKRDRKMLSIICRAEDY